MANSICPTCGSTEQTGPGIFRRYPLVTQGIDLEMDVLGICVQALGELNDLQKTSIVTYLASRFGVFRDRR